MHSSTFLGLSWDFDRDLWVLMVLSWAFMDFDGTFMDFHGAFVRGDFMDFHRCSVRLRVRVRAFIVRS